MGDRDVVRRGEFDRYRDDLRRELDRWRDSDERRFERIEQDIEDLQTEHNTDMRGLAVQRTTELQQATTHREQRREWTWGQIIAGASLIVATAGVAVALAALWLDTLRR